MKTLNIKLVMVVCLVLVLLWVLGCLCGCETTPQFVDSPYYLGGLQTSYLPPYELLMPQRDFGYVRPYPNYQPELPSWDISEMMRQHRIDDMLWHYEYGAPYPFTDWSYSKP